MLKLYDAKEIFAWVVDDPSGKYGIPAINVQGVPMPMISSDRAVIEKLRSSAKQCAKELKLSVRLQHYTQMTVIDVVQP